MSIGLAITKVAEYTAKHMDGLSKIDLLEAELEGVVDGDNTDTEAMRQIQRQLTAQKTKVGLYQQFLEFWRDQIKAFLAILKLTNELANPGR